jgi:hypothetical protein
MTVTATTEVPPGEGVGCRERWYKRCDCERTFKAWGCTAVAVVVFGGLLVLSWDYLFAEYKEVPCLVANVTYSHFVLAGGGGGGPPVIVNSVGFVGCDCGRKCRSQWGTCVRLLGRPVNSSEPVAMIQENMWAAKKDDECTFRERDCPDGEDVQNRMEAVVAAEERALEYNNTVQTCYLRTGMRADGVLYLEKDLKCGQDVMIIFAAVLTLFVCGCCWGVYFNTVMFERRLREEVWGRAGGRKTKGKVIENEAFVV